MQKKNQLAVSNNEAAVLTDVEDLENCDFSENELSDYKSDAAAFSKTLDELDNSSISEKHKVKKNYKQYRKDDYYEKVDNVNSVNENETDADDYQTNSETDDKVENTSDDNIDDYVPKFTGDNSRINKKKHTNFTNNTASSLLVVPVVSGESLTDVENLNSSEDEIDTTNIPIALAKRGNTESTTDEDSLSESSTAVARSYADINLPRVNRELVLIQENESGRPTVIVFPLDEIIRYNMEDNNDIKIETDEEDFSEHEHFLEVASPIRGPTPELPIFEGGTIEEAQDVKLHLSELRAISPIVETLTDTEELRLGTKNKKKLNKTQLAKKRSNMLTVQTEDAAAKTDVEDIDFSDQECRRHHLTVSPLENRDGNTDIENIATDDEYSNEEIDVIRALSSTPLHMRALEGETIITKEGSGPFDKEVRQQINKHVLPIRKFTASPMLTDTEDLVASADEDVTYSRANTATPIEIRRELDDVSSSKVTSENTGKIDLDAPSEVMYIKGGGFREVLTDVEDMNMSDEEFYPDEHADKCAINAGAKAVLCVKINDCDVSLNWKSNSVCFAYNQGEWDASKKQVEKPISAKETAAIMSAVSEGETSGSSQQPDAGSSASQVSPLRAETEEGMSGVPQEGPSEFENLQQRQTADQQELSEEMRQLLKEMEEETRK